MKVRRLIAASVMAASVFVPGSAAWAGGSLINVGNVNVVDDVCTNVNINLGVEIGKNQNCD